MKMLSFCDPSYQCAVREGDRIGTSHVACLDNVALLWRFKPSFVRSTLLVRHEMTYLAHNVLFFGLSSLMEQLLHSLTSEGKQVLGQRRHASSSILDEYQIPWSWVLSNLLNA